MTLNYLNLTAAIAACILYLLIGNFHAAFWAGIAAITRVSVIMHKKHEK